MVKAVLFDLDGTLCNSLPDIMKSANAALAELGLPPYGENDYKQFIGDGVKMLVHRMIAKHPHTDEDEARLLSVYQGIYLEHSLDLTCPYYGIPELLEELTRRGIRAAVVSNKPMEATRKVVGHLLRGVEFGFVYGQMAPFAPKPDPAAVRYVMEQLGVQPEECLFIGDSGVDIRTGKNAGIFAVGALWGFRTREELLANGADALAEKPSDLLGLLNR